jgi:hypothetical protein
METLLTIAELAVVIKLSEQTIRRYVLNNNTRSCVLHHNRENVEGGGMYSLGLVLFIRSRVEYPALQGVSSNFEKSAGLRPGSTINFLSNDDTSPFRARRVIPMIIGSLWSRSCQVLDLTPSVWRLFFTTAFTKVKDIQGHILLQEKPMNQIEAAGGNALGERGRAGQIADGWKTRCPCLRTRQGLVCLRLFLPASPLTRPFTANGLNMPAVNDRMTRKGVSVSSNPWFYRISLVKNLKTRHSQSVRNIQRGRKAEVSRNIRRSFWENCISQVSMTEDEEYAIAEKAHN